MNQMTRSVRLSSRSLAIISLFLWICAVQALGQDWKTVHDGVEYAEVTRDVSGLNVNINLVRLDLSKVRLDVVHAFDKSIGTETISSIAASHHALAAINAGFFRLDKSPFAGDPEGIFQIDGKLLSEPRANRIQLMIDNRPRATDVFIGRMELQESIKLGKDTLEITGVNRERKADDLIMYTPEFGATTMANADGVEVVVSRFKVAAVSKGLVGTVIPPDGFVLSASGKYGDLLIAAASKNERVTYIRHASGIPAAIRSDPMSYPSEWDIVGGVPQLIKDGRIEITWETEKTSKSFVETRHPRTAVAKLKDGKFLLITIDGRTEASGGIGLQDLAEYLLTLGATDAMNLDGGGSTTMYLDGKVVNHPSDKEGERKVSDALIVTPRGKR
jgi:Phosphodiester glycosidase